ncbi:MAG: (2Fe-2S)-binding protein [Planctomycetaceae bacterium]|nr:(2Fe-2S)-binding protein [Planctomycetaceae bacterium]
MLANPPSDATDRVVCHCLQVRESQLSECVQTFGLESVPDVRAHCGAGGGCMACHRRIRDFIAAQRSACSLP